ncbi:MAG: hypothetical protein R3C60_01985 [Parvularculaceae bacterium]
MIRYFVSLLPLIAIGCVANGPIDAELPASTAAAPDVPDAEIFIGELSFNAGTPSVADLTNATMHKGYDNQPWFIPGEDAFYYAAEGESGKTDIRLYDIARRASQAIFTSTDRSEYSPRRTPDGTFLSYIQESPDGEVTKVFKRSLDGSDEGAAVIDFAPLGYYAWLDGGAALGVYYRTDPGSLYRADVSSGEETLLYQSIERTLIADPAGAKLWFSAITTHSADEETPDRLRVMRYDSVTQEIVPIADLPQGASDFAIVFDQGGAAEGIFAASGSRLYWTEMGESADWNEVMIEPAISGAVNFSRVAVSSDHRSIAIVGELAE